MGVSHQTSVMDNLNLNLTGHQDSHNNFTNSSQIAAVGVHDFHAEKHRQLHIILAIIVSVFSACVVILVAYMVIFPASYSEVDTRPRENSLTGSSSKVEDDDNKT